MTETKTEGRQVRAVFANYRRTVTNKITGEQVFGLASKTRGEMITDFAPGEEERLDSLNALMPAGGEKDPERLEESLLDAAMRRALNPTDVASDDFGAPLTVSPPSLGQEPRGSFTAGDTGVDPADASPPEFASTPDVLVRVDAPDVEDTAALSEFIRTGGDGGKALTGSETVALAEDDPDRARAVLEAERQAQGGDPRGNVEKPLQKIIDGQ